MYALNNGPNTTLVVTVIEAKPPVELSQISWSRDGVTIDVGLARYTISVTGNMLSLTIVNPTHSDSSRYTVSVQHPAGNVSTFVTLTVLGTLHLYFIHV